MIKNCKSKFFPYFEVLERKKGREYMQYTFLPFPKKKKKSQSNFFPTNHQEEIKNIERLASTLFLHRKFSSFLSISSSSSFSFLFSRKAISRRRFPFSRTNIHGIKPRLAPRSYFVIRRRRARLCASDRRAKTFFRGGESPHKHPCWLAKRRCNC